MTGALSVKGFNEISYDELMDVNGGSALGGIAEGVAVMLGAGIVAATSPVSIPLGLLLMGTVGCGFIMAYESTKELYSSI